MSTTKALRKYTATFVLDTRNYTNPVETLIEKLTGVIESIGGTVSKVNNLGQRDFARAVDRKFPAGIYVEITFEGPTESMSVLNEKLKLDKTVNRIFVQSA